MPPATKASVGEVSPHKWYPLPLSDGQIEEITASIRSYFQNARLSAKGMGNRQIKIIFSLLCLDIYPDDTQVALIDGDFFACKDGEEPHPLLLEGGIPDDSGPRGDKGPSMDWHESCSNRPSDEGKTKKTTHI